MGLISMTFHLRAFFTCFVLPSTSAPCVSCWCYADMQWFCMCKTHFAYYDAAHVEGVRVLVDAAHVVGNVPRHDVASLDVDYYCFGGQKGLRGPAGMGGSIMRAHGLSSCATAPPPSVAPVISLGDVPTKDSWLQEAPVCTPGTRREGGAVELGWCEVRSANVAGLAGLAAAVRAQLGDHLDGDFNAHGQALAQHVAHALRELRDGEEGGAALVIYGAAGAYHVGLYGPPECANTDASMLSLISFNIQGLRAQQVGSTLAAEHGIIINGGLQCAPEAHEMLGTHQTFSGTARVSFGPQNTATDADLFINAVRALLCQRNVPSGTLTKGQHCAT